MTEDGIERGNEFLYNLGALTRKVDRKIPDNGSNGDESDDEPSTFWMTNPSNIWVGNVAAGSEDNGFWMELIKRGPREDLYPDIVPKYEPLGRFENNVAHSNADVSAETFTVWAFQFQASSNHSTFLSSYRKDSVRILRATNPRLGLLSLDFGRIGTMVTASSFITA